MTPAQFEVIAQLLQSKKGALCVALELVLVKGLKPYRACKLCGVAPQSISRALKRYRATHALISEAWNW